MHILFFLLESHFSLRAHISFVGKVRGWIERPQLALSLGVEV